MSYDPYAGYYSGSHGYQSQQYDAHSPSYPYPTSTSMLPSASADSNGSSNSIYSDYSGYSSNTYDTSPSTYTSNDPYAFAHQSSYSTSSGHQPQPPLPRARPTTSVASPSPSPTSGKEKKPKKDTPYVCLHPGCLRSFARTYDLDRHVKTHFPETAQRLDCPEAVRGSFCGRIGDRGFTRNDHLNEHLRKVHRYDIRKSARGTRSS